MKTELIKEEKHHKRRGTKYTLDFSKGKSNLQLVENNSEDIKNKILKQYRIGER